MAEETGEARIHDQAPPRRTPLCPPFLRGERRALAPLVLHPGPEALGYSPTPLRGSRTDPLETPPKSTTFIPAPVALSPTSPGSSSGPPPALPACRSSRYPSAGS